MISKRGFRVLLVVIFSLVVLMPVSAAPVNNINIVINGDLIPVDPAPIMVDGRVLVPFRPVAEAMGAKVEWFADDGRVEVRRGLKFIKIWVPTGLEDYYRDYAIVNGDLVDLDVAPQLIQGRTYIPLRLISEGLGAKISWNQSISTVNIEIPPIKPLEGMAASVRDSVYKTAVADSYKFSFDTQLKLPKYPQLNFVKLNGAKDKNNNIYVNGHLAGWLFEGLILDDNYYLKSILFNNKWVGPSDFGVDEEALEEAKAERQEAETKYKQEAYDSITEIIRALGQPKVTAEEYIGGVICEKIEFTPTAASIQAFMDWKSVTDDLEGAAMILWVGKTDKLAHKVDFQVNFNQFSYESDKEEPGFVNVIAEFLNINEDFKVEKPADLKK